MARWWSSRLAVVVLFLSLATSLFAADGPLVATDVSQVDRDYWFQGEYLGSVNSLCGRCESCGLQVVSLGKNEFQAVLFRGGLPDGGWWTGHERHELKGQRDRTVLRLNGSTRRVEIRDSKASVFVVDEGQRVPTAHASSENAFAIGELIRVERRSQTLGLKPPSGASVLFDGSQTGHWKNGKVTNEGLLMIGTETRQAFRDFHLHVEFLLPYMPDARGQGRANSGVYIQSRYEVQVLDSFGLKGTDNECAGLYKFKAPDANMCLPPLVWQTYDIEFQSPNFDVAGRKVCSGIISVWHNGVLVQNAVALANKTGGGSAEGPKALPTKLQDHGNPVRFRNIWLIERGGGGTPIPNCSSPRLAQSRPSRR